MELLLRTTKGNRIAFLSLYTSCILFRLLTLAIVYVSAKISTWEVHNYLQLNEGTRAMQMPSSNQEVSDALLSDGKPRTF